MFYERERYLNGNLMFPKASQFFQDSHDIVSRLSPWIQRDLQVILQDNDVHLIKDLVIVLAKK